jgi:hypothetical protein
MGSFPAPGGSASSPSDLTARSGETTQVKIGKVTVTGTDYAGLDFGNPGDTKIYRAGAGIIRVDAQLNVQSTFRSLSGYAYFGSGSEIGIGTIGPAGQFGIAINGTNLYRFAPDVLKTDDDLEIISGKGLILTDTVLATRHRITLANGILSVGPAL